MKYLLSVLIAEFLVPEGLAYAADDRGPEVLVKQVSAEVLDAITPRTRSPGNTRLCASAAARASGMRSSSSTIGPS